MRQVEPMISLVNNKGWGAGWGVLHTFLGGTMHGVLMGL